jgi:hypothetical protein
MTLAEELYRKYALTSFKAKGTSLPILAINEALETAAGIADQEGSSIAASRIRSLKWIDRGIVPSTVAGAESGRTIPVALVNLYPRAGGKEAGGS